MRNTSQIESAVAHYEALSRGGDLVRVWLSCGCPSSHPPTTTSAGHAHPLPCAAPTSPCGPPTHHVSSVLLLLLRRVPRPALPPSPCLVQAVFLDADDSVLYSSRGSLGILTRDCTLVLPPAEGGLAGMAVEVLAAHTMEVRTPPQAPA